MKNKILLITNIPNPYRLPLFNELHKQLNEKGFVLKVVFGSHGYARRKWKIDFSAMHFDYVILKSIKVALFNKERTLFFYNGLLREIKKFNPAIVITLGFSIATAKIWLLSFFKDIKYIIWTGSIINEYRNNSKVRSIQRKVLAARSSGFAVYGTKSKEYLMSIGIPEEKISIVINTVDTEFFANIHFSRNNIPHHLTFIGDLSKRKNVLKLLNSIIFLKKIRSDFILDIIGEGAEKNNLIDFVRDNELEDNIIFHGYKQKKEIPEILSCSKVFLFQTDFDIWGLVLVEAMAAGIPCLASVHAGATHDLIKDNETGYIVDYAQSEIVCNKISYLLDNQPESERIGNNARLYIKKHLSIQKSASGFLSSISKII